MGFWGINFPPAKNVLIWRKMASQPGRLAAKKAAKLANYAKSPYWRFWFTRRDNFGA
jgi:hypothetical protein